MKTSNLANVYAEMLRNYGEKFTITYSNAASYLTSIVGSNEAREKLIFVFIEDRSGGKMPNFVTPSKPNINKTDGQHDLNLTGSPLKDNCTVDTLNVSSLDIKQLLKNPWSLAEECHRGIKVQRARLISSSEDFQMADDTGTASGSVWFLCDGTDSEKTLFLQYVFNPEYYCRGMVTFRGVEPVNTVNSQSLLQSHYELTPLKSKVDTYIENIYQINSKVSIRCSWSTTVALPTLVDLSSCDVTLTQTFQLNDCGDLTQDLINQLRILMVIRNDIIAYKASESNVSEKEMVYRCGRGINMDELRESVNKIMTDISSFPETYGPGEKKTDIESVLKHFSGRHLTDLTDKLWNILKCCSSYKDLKMAFYILFQCAARCNIVNTPTNKNRLAEIITGIVNHRLAIPCLTGCEPLELLLEIGLEKLFKDYEYIFNESKICSANMLRNIGSLAPDDSNSDRIQSVRKSLHNAVLSKSPTMSRKTFLRRSNDKNNKSDNDSFGFKNSYFDETVSGSTLAKLVQIHCTLEHLLLMNKHLGLSNVFSDVCERLLTKTPRPISAIDDNLTDEVEISLSAHNIREHLEGRVPHSRRITMKSKSKFRKVTSTFFYSMNNICPPGISEVFQTDVSNTKVLKSEVFENDDKPVAKENVYYSWLYRKITTV